MVVNHQNLDSNQVLMVDQLKMILYKIILNKSISKFQSKSQHSRVIRLLRRHDNGLRFRSTLLTSTIRDKRDLLDRNEN